MGGESRGISSTFVFGVAGGKKKLSLISLPQALNLVTGGEENPIKNLIKISLFNLIRKQADHKCHVQEYSLGLDLSLS